MTGVQTCALPISAHVLAACAPIRKELVERLKTRRVETGVFEGLDAPAKVPHLSEPEYSLPLQEIDVVINGHTTEAGVIDSSSQIVAIWKDLAQEIAAHINTQIHLKMEGANSTTNWTLGCVQYLPMQIGDKPFKIHAHVVEKAPFHLLLGHPFHKLLL